MKVIERPVRDFLYVDMQRTLGQLVSMTTDKPIAIMLNAGAYNYLAFLYQLDSDRTQPPLSILGGQVSFDKDKKRFYYTDILIGLYADSDALHYIFYAVENEYDLLELTL